MHYDLYDAPTSPPNPGKRLLLMGLSKDGPINAPIPITSLRQAEEIFGSREYGDLIYAYMQARLQPGITIYLMRITGEYARATLVATVESEEREAIQLRSMHGGSFYNSIRMYMAKVPKDNVQKDALIFEIPKYGMTSRGYILEDYDTIDDLVRQINIDTRGKRNLVYANTSLPFLSPMALLANDKPIRMDGGHDGLTINQSGLEVTIPKDNLFLALENSYSLLVGQEYDIVCPVSVNFDDAHPAYFYGTASYGSAYYASDDDYLGLVDTENDDQLVTFHEQLIEFCRKQESYGLVTHGVLGMRTIRDLDSLTKYNFSYVAAVAQATALSTRYGLMYYQSGQWVDKGQYASVWAHDLIFYTGTPDEFMANGAVLYAAMIAGMGDDENLTNKTLPKGVTLRYELADDEIEDLATLGIVAARFSVKRGPVISSSVTLSLYASPLHFLPNIRQAQLALAAINNTMDDMIGGNYVPGATEREIDRRISDVLNQLVTRKVLREYGVSTNYNRSENQGYISLELLTKYSVEKISTGANILFAQKGVV